MHHARMDTFDDNSAHIGSSHTTSKKKGSIHYRDLSYCRADPLTTSGLASRALPHQSSRALIVPSSLKITSSKNLALAPSSVKADRAA